MQMMNNKIDVTEITKSLEDRLKEGLNSKSLDITDISILIGQHLEQIKEKILKDSGVLISNELNDNKQDVCKDCGSSLKKTKN